MQSSPSHSYNTRRAEASSSSADDSVISSDDLARAYFNRQAAMPAPNQTDLDPSLEDPPDSAAVQAAIAVLQRAGHEVKIRGLRDFQQGLAAPSTLKNEKPLIEIVANQAKPPEQIRGPPKRKYSMVQRPSVESSSRRLSSALVADPNDPDCRPYACAYASCSEQSLDPSSGIPVAGHAAAFRTSSELLVHWKSTHEHEGEAGLEKPFMCAIDGCFKDWKNLAGINYHIQVSNDHFNNKSRKVAGDDVEVATRRQSKTKDEREAARRFRCPVPGCTKAYQQTSGLKYHLTSGKEHEADDIGDWQALVTQSMANALHTI